MVSISRSLFSRSVINCNSSSSQSAIFEINSTSGDRRITHDSGISQAFRRPIL